MEDKLKILNTDLKRLWILKRTKNNRIIKKQRKLLDL
jgi:hypothetical protein